MTTANLFLEDTLIGTDEAPQRVLEAERLALTYRAILKKRIGRITADDFLKYASRFSILCNEIYQGSKLELRRNKGIPLGFDADLASRGHYMGDPGEVIGIDTLTADFFRETFKRSSSIVLSIKPTVSRDDIRHSFAKIEWTRDRPWTIFFYAQQGGRHDLESNHGPLENLLLRKLFHVSGVAPSLNFAVKLGIDAWFDETA